MIRDPVSSSKVKMAPCEVELRRIDPGKNRRLEREVILSRFSFCLSLSLDRSAGCETGVSVGVNEVACLRYGRGGTGTRG